MKIIKPAVAGTLESSDALVRIEPADTLDIEINSSVGKEFDDAILAALESVLTKLEVEAARIVVEDKGALDCVLQARIKSAALRASDEEENWEKLL